MIEGTKFLPPHKIYFRDIAPLFKGNRNKVMYREHLETYQHSLAREYLL